MQHPTKLSSFIAIPLLSLATACSGADDVAFAPSNSHPIEADGGAACEAPPCTSTNGAAGTIGATGGAHSAEQPAGAGGAIGGSGGSSSVVAAGGATAIHGSGGMGAGGANTLPNVDGTSDVTVEVGATDGPGAFTLHSKAGTLGEAQNGLSLNGDVTVGEGDSSVTLTDAKLSLTTDASGHVTDVTGVARIYVPKVSLQVLVGGYVNVLVHLDTSHEHRMCTPSQTPYPTQPVFPTQAPLDENCLVLDIDSTSATAIGTLGLGLGLGAEVIVTSTQETSILQAKLSGNALLDIPATLCAAISL